MEKKRAALDSHPPASPEPLYRYHANLGTFLIHRWIRQGADRGRIDEAKAARDEIARALEINPDAHFGREKYQLRAIEWMIDPPQSADSQWLPNFLNLSPPSMGYDLIEPNEADEMVRGLSGLIVLGNAWESVDVFNALCLALQHDTLGFSNDYGGGRNSLAMFAWFRCKELIKAGKGSLLPDAPKGDALLAKILPPMTSSALEMLDAAFQKLRAEADAWQAARTDFMTAKLTEGLHPDVDSDFWDDYKETGPPPLPMTSPEKANHIALASRQQRAKLILVGIVLGFVGFVVGLVVLQRARDQRDKPEAPASEWLQ